MSIQTIMTADQSGFELVEFAKKTAESLTLSDTQIRTIFSEVRSIEALWSNDPVKARRRLNMLKPKLAYQAARDYKVKALRDILTEAIGFVESTNDEKRGEMFKRFVDLFEAILAYYKAKPKKERY